MRILISGLPLFGRRLAEDLKAAEPDAEFRSFDTYYSRADQLWFMANLPFADAVISLNGVTDKSGSLGATLLFRKKLVLQWMGTDALLAMERFKNGTIYRKYVDAAVHWVDSPWLMEEVSSIGVKPEYVYLKYARPVAPVDAYASLHVVSYISQHRQLFYGLERLVRLAEKFPDIPFHIYGITNAEISIPSNVILHGWVSEEAFREALRNAPLFLRLTEHEGFPYSVIEAMSVGAEVIMSMPYPPVCVARTEEEIENCFVMLRNRILARGLTPNPEMIRLSDSDFNKTQIIRTYLQKLHQLTGK